MNMHSDESVSPGNESDPEKFRHRLRNEAHAIWLGTRLLLEHLKKENSDDAMLICKALIDSAESLKKLVESK